jgi:hypothetical protein
MDDGNTCTYLDPFNSLITYNVQNGYMVNIKSNQNDILPDGYWLFQNTPFIENWETIDVPIDTTYDDL